MKTLKELLDKKTKHISLWKERMASDKNNEDKFSGNFYHYHLLLGINNISESDFISAKINFNICALIDEFRIIKFNNRHFDYSNHINYAVLTDNQRLIQRYSKLRYQKGRNAELSMDDMILLGESSIWSNTVQLFMVEDFEGVKNNLAIIEKKTIPNLPKDQQELRIDFDFFKALLVKDKLKCEELVNRLLNDKVHKTRNDNEVINKYISQPALGYAKLAWRLGVEVEVKKKN